MTEIERLEQEIKEAQSKLKRLKSEKAEGERLSFRKYHMFGDGRFGYFGGSERLVASLRDFVCILSTIHKSTNNDGAQRIDVSIHKTKVKDISEKRLRVCNAFIDEIYPFVSKYVEIFLEIGDDSNQGRIGDSQ